MSQTGPQADLQSPPGRYCCSLTRYERYPTREVRIGDTPLGADHPIRVQSMTTTDTMDSSATVAQSIRIIEAGADYVRITAPSLNEAHNLQAIKDELAKRGYVTPLIADIHFTPNAAEVAAQIVDKVRINPGNYADRKKFEQLDYSEAEYAAEIDRIRERFTPLIEVCKDNGTAMRIGTNHGSLSDRIMGRFGDTPLGMVESALEFVRICRQQDYHDIVLSMKSSNPKVMVQACRLLVHRMASEGMDYPLHLGVTEAGDGEDGRIKSALGIGSLLEDGLGDTVRVSLTEEPEAEIPVCLRLVERYAARSGHATIPEAAASPVDPFSYTRRASRKVGKSGGETVPIVVGSLAAGNHVDPDALAPLGYRYDRADDRWHIDEAAADYVYLGGGDLAYPIPCGLDRIFDHALWLALADRNAACPLFDVRSYLTSDVRSERANFVLCTLADLSENLVRSARDDPASILVLRTDNAHAMSELRRAFVDLVDQGCDVPVVFKREHADAESTLLFAATDVGGLLIDGLGDGIWLDSPASDPGVINRASFGILQAARTRISKTEYISCPSCGRTLFDLQTTTAQIRERTSHLKGVKIGIMGCIVNGPGEMADADFGYVGSGPGQITLYRGKDVVLRSIPAAGAVDALIGLIRQDGRWVDP